MTERLEEITAERERFVRWATTRLGSVDEAEDVVQRALERAVTGLTAEVEQPLPWFWGVLKRALVDHVRAQARADRRVERFRALDVPEDPTPAPEPCGCGVHMIAELPESQRSIIERVYLEDETLVEAAQALSISASAARVRAHRARKELKTKIERCCGVTTFAEATVCACS